MHYVFTFFSSIVCRSPFMFPWAFGNNFDFPAFVRCYSWFCPQSFVKIRDLFRNILPEIAILSQNYCQYSRFLPRSFDEIRDLIYNCFTKLAIYLYPCSTKFAIFLRYLLKDIFLWNFAILFRDCFTKYATYFWNCLTDWWFYSVIETRD